MIEEKKVILTNSCALIETKYGEGIKDVDLEYTEHSQDHFYSDTKTSVTITKEKAEEIVNFLCDSFGI